MARLTRDVVIGHFDAAVRSLRTYTETCPNPEHLVGLYPALVEVRAKFEQATAPVDSATLVTNLVRETVSITLGKSTVEAYVDAEELGVAHVTIRATDGSDDIVHHGTAKWDGERLSDSGLQLALDPDIKAARESV